MSNALTDFNRRLDEVLTPAVKTILAINIFVFLAVNILGAIKPGFGEWFIFWTSQYPPLSVLRLQVWRFLTHAFVHAGVLHLLFNMLILFFFGTTLESRWGTRWFWFYYLTAAVGGGVIHAALAMIFGIEVNAWVIGASGAINAIMFAFACYYPNAEVYLFGVLPIKAWVLVTVLIVITIFSMGGRGNVSHLTHLGGLITGYIMLAIYHKDYDVRTWRWR